MFSKLLSEKNRYFLINLIFFLSLLLVFLFLVAVLKESALSVLTTTFGDAFNNIFFTILFLIYTGIFIVYLIVSAINQKVVISGTVVYFSCLVNTLQLFNLKTMGIYFSRLIANDVMFIKKFIFIVLYTFLFVITVYSLIVFVKFIWRIIKRRVIDFDPPKINNTELQQVIGIYYLDFEYNKELSYYVTYETKGKIIREDITSNKLLCLVGDLLKDEEYEIKLYSLGKLKAKFTALESEEKIKFTLSRKPTELQERIAYYYHYHPELIECYISIMGLYDKMFKRLLIHSPEVIIIESMTKKTIFSKIYLEKENIVVRFSANPYLLEGLDVINSFEEDCLLPTKYIVRNIEDVNYLKKVVEKIKSIKK